MPPFTTMISKLSGFVFLMSDTIGNADEKWETLIMERKARYSMKIWRALEKENE